MADQERLKNLVRLRQLLKQRQQLTGDSAAQQIGAEQEQELSAFSPLKQTLGQRAKKAGKQLLGGASGSVIGTVVGAQEFLKDKGLPYSEEVLERDKRRLKYIERGIGDSFAGQAGEVVGDVLQLAVPGGAAMKGARALNLGRGATGASVLGADVAGSAGLGALGAEEGQRLPEALAAGGAALAGAGVGKLGEKAVQGIAKTDAAQRMLDRGVRLMPGEASEGSIPRLLDWRKRYTGLFSRKGMEQLQKRGLSDWNKSILKQVAPEGAEITKIGSAGADELKSAYTKAYDDAWAGAQQLSNDGAVGLANSAGEIFQRYGEDSRRYLVPVMNKLREASQKRTPESIRALDKEIRRQAESSATGLKADFEIADALRGLKDQMRQYVDPDTANALRKIDSKWSEFLTVRKAATRSQARKNDQVFTPDDLLEATGKVAGESGAFGSGSPLFREAMDAVETIGRKNPQALLQTRQAIAANAPSPTPMLDLRRRTMLGQTAPQTALQGLSPIARALREAGISPATIAGASALQSEDDQDATGR